MKRATVLIGVGLLAVAGLWSCAVAPVVMVALEELPELTNPDCDAASWAPVADPQMVNTTTADYQRDPRVLVLTNGRVAVCWVSVLQDGDETGLFLMILDGDGTPLTEEIQVNQYTADKQDTHAMTALPNGAFVIAWQSGPFLWENLPSPDGSGTGVFARIFNADGAPVTDEFQVNEHAFHDQLEVGLTTLSDGSFLAVWTSSREMEFSEGAFGTNSYLAVKRYASDGTVLMDEMVAQDHETIGAINLQIEPGNAAIAALTQGRFALAWQQARLHPDENRIGPPYPRRIRARVFENDGRPVGDVIEVSQQSNAETNTEINARVAALPGGGFAVAWDSVRPGGAGVVMRHFDRNGTPRGNEYLAAPLSGRAATTILELDLVPIPDFGVVLGTAQHDATSGQTASIQLFDAAGQPFGQAAVVELDGSFFQSLSIHGGANGRLAAAYVMSAQDFADRDDVVVRLLGCP